jgi:L-amino acid N-acyltransferase YncA
VAASMEHPNIRPMTQDDWPAVWAIYAAGIATGDATFETEPPSWERFDASRREGLRLVATIQDEVVGWAAAAPVSDREVYRGVAEHSVYVDPAWQGHGVGRALLEALIHATEEAGVWTLQSGIFAENAPSIALHRACGFRVVGTRKRIGRHHGRWRDVVLVERRSRVAGTLADE